MIDLSKYHNQRVRATLKSGGDVVGTVIYNSALAHYFILSNTINAVGYIISTMIESVEPLPAPKLGRPRLPASERRTPRTAHLTNANWIILEERYGNVTKALESLLAPDPTASIGDVFQVQADGKLLKL